MDASDDVLDRVFLLDTNVASFVLSGKSRAARYNSLLVHRQLALSFVTVAEMRFGAYRAGWSPIRVRELDIYMFDRHGILPYDLAVADAWAEIMAACATSGIAVRDNDAWIAASAVRFDCRLLADDKVFARIQSAYPALRLLTPP